MVMRQTTRCENQGLARNYIQGGCDTCGEGEVGTLAREHWSSILVIRGATNDMKVNATNMIQ